MSEYVVVAIKATREQAEAFKTIFPAAKIMEQKKPQQQLEPPTIHEVLEFCKERNSPVDGARFFNYYDPRGWMDARGEKITDWKKKIIEWETNGKNNRKPSPGKLMSAAEYEARGGGKHSQEAIEAFMEWADEFAKVEAEKQGYGR